MTDSAQKLTLEQRLELATKTRKKGRGKNKTLADENKDTTPEHDSSTHPQESGGTNLLGEPFNHKALLETTLSQNPEPVVAEPATDQIVEPQERTSVSLELSSETMKHLSLTNNDLKLPLAAFLARLEAQVSGLVSAHNKAIVEKTDMIAQLHKEGTALSKKELKLNDMLKAMKKDKTKVDMKLEILEKDLLAKISESERLHGEFYTMKEKNQTLQNDYNLALKEKEELKAKLANLADIEMSKLQTEFNVLKKEAQDTKTQYNTLVNEHEQLKLTSSAAYKELTLSKDEETSVLETKIEKLRILLEDRSSDVGETGSTSHNSEYIDKLQAKYNQATRDLQENNENWSAIEKSLNEKLLSLRNDYDAALNLQKELLSKIDVLEKQKGQLAAQLEKEASANSELCKQVVQLSSKGDILQHQLNTAQQDVDMLRDKVNIQEKQLKDLLIMPSSVADSKKSRALRVSTGMGISKLPSHREEDEYTSDGEEHTSRALKLQLEDEWGLQPASKDKNVDLQSEAGSLYDQSFVSVSKFGEALNTPTGFHSVSSFQRNDSNTSLPYIDEPEEPALGRRFSHFATTPTQIQGATASSTQLMARMGGQVRRLETELASLRDSWEKLQKEKAQGQEVIMKLMTEKEELSKFEDKNAELVAHMEQLENEQLSLKREVDNKKRTIMELENDVSDLKDLMHIQIQQMVELQEKCR